MRGKINVAGGSAEKLNVYTQMTEPSKKEGIWIQTDNTYENVEMTSILKQGYYPIKFGNFSTLDFYDATQVVGTNIYMIAGPATGTVSGNIKTLYSYDTLLDIYTKKANLTVSRDYIRIANVRTDIYLFGADIKVGSDYQSIGIYKYDTLNNTYTKLANAPIELGTSGKLVYEAIGVGTDVYLFGLGTTKKETYKYDTLTGEFTQLQKMPGSYTYNPSTICVIDDDVYLFGAGNTTGGKVNYKYNISTNTFTTLASGPIAEQIVVMVGEYIYLFSTDTTYAHRVYQYSPIDNEFTRLTDIVFMLSFYGLSVYTGIKNYLYAFHVQMTNNASTSGNVFVDFKYAPINNLTIDTYKENTIYIATGETNTAKLLETSEINFDDVWLYKDSALQEYPTYIGNGTSWEKIKN